MYERGGGDHVSVGMRKPSGEYERPIPGTRLFWTKPGNHGRAENACTVSTSLCLIQSLRKLP